MKSLIPLVTLLALFAMVPLGCGKNESSTDALDLAKVEQAFASAKGSIKAEFEKVVAAIKSADYSGALTKLQTLAANAELSEEQKGALSDLLAQVKSKAGELMTTAGQAAGQMVDEARDAAAKAADSASDAAKKAADNLRQK